MSNALHELPDSTSFSALPQALRRLPASPELASTIIEALADAVVIFDATGLVVGVNPAAANLFGLTLPARQAALAVPFTEREPIFELLTLDGHPVPYDQLPAVRLLRGEHLAGEHTMDVVVSTSYGQERVINISGTPLEDADGHVLGAVIVCRDITRRTSMERELTARAAELESIFATQVEAVAFVNKAGLVIRMNEAQRRLLEARGINPDGEDIALWSQEAPPHDAQGKLIPRERLAFYRALRGETVTPENAVEIYHRTQDGREMVVRVSAAPVRDAQGQIVGAVVTTHDVTTQRQLEHQRLAVMRMVAHDIASPVAAVRLYLQTQQRRIAQGNPPFTPDEQMLPRMDHALRRMLRLVEDMRVATQIELGTLTVHRLTHDLAALCREEADSQQLVSGREVLVDTRGESVWAEVDAERIGQVVSNLLSNALKYSPADQPVSIAVQAIDGQARVTVSDAGPGIPADELPRVFDQFHRVAGIKTHDGTSGLGLGLYISKAIITAHGGDIGVDSAVGHGSTFWFTLPLPSTKP